MRGEDQDAEAPWQISASIAIFTSFCSIFLPRYSGVRPTIRPAMNTARIAVQQHAVEARADAAEDHLVGLMLNSGTRPPSGVKLSCMLLTAPQLASVVTVANSAECGDAEADSLPSMLPPGCVVGRGALDAELREDRIAGLLGPIGDEHADQEHHAIAANSAQPCRVSLTMLPNV